MVDILTVIPYTEISELVLGLSQAHLLYLLKLIRLTVVFNLLDYKIFMKQIKAMYDKKVLALIKSNKEENEDQT